MNEASQADQSEPPASIGWPQFYQQLSMMDGGGTIMFYEHVLACQIFTMAEKILDFGAGRGAALVRAIEAGHKYLEHLHDLRTMGAHVTACDVDDVVLTHPASDKIVVMENDNTLPFADASFDLIVSDFTFEHIAKPAAIATELVRVLKPGGVICARTPNKHSYVALAASIIPARIYDVALKAAQPDREDQDKFPVVYKLNDEKSLRKHFAGCELHVRYPDFEPSYFFGSKIIHMGFRALHRILPAKLRTGLIITVRKPEAK